MATTQGTTPQTTTKTEDITLTRTFDAPRKLVFSMWTDAKHLAAWWGPHGWTNPRSEADPRPGGKILIHMQAPDGTVHPMTGTFDEIAEPECLVFRAVPVDRHGAALLESLTTVTFHDLGDRTKVIVHASAAPLQPIGVDMLKGMDMGWSQSLERLAQLVTQR